jgi:hypothetical protein
MKKWIVDIINALLILLFAYTSISKLVHIDHFRYVLSKAPLTGDYSSFFAWAIILVEIVIVLLLFTTIRTGLYAAALLLILFTTYLLYMILTKSTLPCSCGGVIQKLSWRQHIFFNTFFILISIVAIYILNYLHKQERFRTKY